MLLDKVLTAFVSFAAFIVLGCAQVLGHLSFILAATVSSGPTFAGPTSFLFGSRPECSSECFFPIPSSGLHTLAAGMGQFRVFGIFG